MSVLVVDVGTSSVRATVVADDASVSCSAQRAVAPLRPVEGAVELDATAIGAAALALCAEVLERCGPVAAVGVATQRASVLLFDVASGAPLGPGIGWQDLRTAGRCLSLSASTPLRLMPNQTATKLEFLLDRYDRDRARARSGAIRAATLDTWLCHVLSGGTLHVSDASSAGVTGLVLPDASDYDPQVLEALRIPRAVLPRLVDSAGVLAGASAIAGAPPIAGVIGDQQASLIGQGGLAPGVAKLTFGTGAMLDCSTGDTRPGFEQRGPAGCFPIVTHRIDGRVHWGIEAIMLSAGSAVDWLRDGLELIASAAETDELAGSVRDAGGVHFVPALGGLGTPVWDFGARGTLVGLHGATTRAEVVRAVLEGIAHRGADLLEAAEADSGRSIETLRVDGGMSDNTTFVQVVADATGRVIELAPVREATTLGAAFLAGSAVGIWPDLDAAAALAPPRAAVEPRRRLDRGRWLEARARAERQIPFLSALRF